MSKIEGVPPGTITYSNLLETLGMNSKGLHRSGLSEFLSYYQIGMSKLYLAEDVAKVQYWLFVQRGLAALGLITPSPPAPLLPPGDSHAAKRTFLDAWVEEDPNGVDCPRCEGPAVQDSLGQGPIWCPKCG